VTETTIEVGTIVDHPKKPEWGPGRVLAVGGGGHVTVYFRDLEEKKTGDAVKTISTAVIKLGVAAEQSDSMLDNLPTFAKGKFQGARKPRLSLDQAVQAFVNSHPDGFEGPVYIEQERLPKMNAHQMWQDLLGGGQAEELLDQGKIAEARKRLLKVNTKIGLLSASERTALKEALDDDEAAEPFMRALIKVVSQPAPDRTTYQNLIDTVEELPQRESGTQVAIWPVLTQFPFIACPEHHVFLKPTVTQKGATRLNFDLHYTVGLNWWTYDQALVMARILLERLGPLGAKDNIDVQSFIAVVATA